MIIPHAESFSGTPLSLTPEHLDDLRKSGLSDDTIRAPAPAAGEVVAFSRFELRRLCTEVTARGFAGDEGGVA